MKKLIIALTMLFVLPVASAEPDITDIQQRWAHIQYEVEKSQREEAFAALAERTELLVHQHPQQAGVLIWQGIVLSSQAGEKGGLGALALVKQARRVLETALEVDELALDGSAYTTLGSLYYQVPGWPLAFGDDKKAGEYLRRALQINPQGIDANFFYGDYLLEQGESDRARTYLEKVLSAPGRPGRALADTGRRQEARELLSQL